MLALPFWWVMMRLGSPNPSEIKRWLGDLPWFGLSRNPVPRLWSAKRACYSVN